MNDLQLIEDSGEVYADSRDVAEMIGRPHYDLLKNIRNYVKFLTEGNFPVSEFFEEAEYEDSTGRTLPCYFLTKKGCDMVANKLTGKSGVLFTAAYVTAFEKMRERLNGRYAPESLPFKTGKAGRCKIEYLPEDVRGKIDKCLMDGQSMERVSYQIAILTGLYISPSSVRRYCNKYFESTSEETDGNNFDGIRIELDGGGTAVISLEK